MRLFLQLKEHLIRVVHVRRRRLLPVDSRTGERLEVDAQPLPPPDRSRFITTSLDLEGALLQTTRPRSTVLPPDAGFEREQDALEALLGERCSPVRTCRETELARYLDVAPSGCPCIEN